MAQKIFIDSRAGNRRIEKAIPQFMSRFGMAKDQATAVAIRLESLGRLQGTGEPINKPKRTKGLPIPVPNAAVLAAITAMKKDRTPKRTQVRTSPDQTFESAYDVPRAARRQTRSNRLRSRVTRGR